MVNSNEHPHLMLVKHIQGGPSRYIYTRIYYIHKLFWWNPWPLIVISWQISSNINQSSLQGAPILLTPTNITKSGVPPGQNFHYTPICRALSRTWICWKISRRLRPEHSSRCSCKGTSSWSPAMARNTTNQWIGFRENFNRKAPYLMGKSMVSCRFSRKPIHCTKYQLQSQWVTPVHGSMT